MHAHVRVHARVHIHVHVHPMHVHPLTRMLTCMACMQVCELEAALNALGLATSPTEAERVLKRFDTDASGTLELDEYGRLVEELGRFHRNRQVQQAAHAHAHAPPPPPQQRRHASSGAPPPSEPQPRHARDRAREPGGDPAVEGLRHYMAEGNKLPAQRVPTRATSYP